MPEQVYKDAQSRMQNSHEALVIALRKIRTGRAQPSMLEDLRVLYYGQQVPLKQVASIQLEDARTLAVSPWEKNLVPELEKAIARSELGLNPVTHDQVVRVTLPQLTEENRKLYARQARQDAETCRVAIRNVRRDANGALREMVKNKELSEDEERREQERIQALTDRFIAQVDSTLAAKEQELLKV